MQSPAARPVPTTPVQEYSPVELDIFAALNRARQNPRAMATDLETVLPYYNGRLFQRPGQPVPIQTSEGVAAAREAIAGVRSQPPLGPLSISPELTRAARDHAADQGRTGSIGHVGSDGSTVDARVSRYGTWRTSLSENIDYSPATKGAFVVQNLLIDDGVSDRGHRKNIYTASANLVGIACGPHPRYGSLCVIVQAGGISTKPNSEAAQRASSATDVSTRVRLAHQK